MKVKEESEKVALKFNIQKTEVTASGPITSWQIDGETVADFILGVPKNHFILGGFQSHFILGSSKITAGEGNGTPLQYSCLENPMDGGAW